MGAATFAAYLPGAGRALDYDSAVTVGRFVRTPSVLDALRNQEQFNNHPAFSLLEHVVHSITGSADEAVLRLLPIAFSAATVSVVVWAALRYVATLPAALAGLVVATNPAFATLGRAVRGYSLLVLCATVASVALWRLLQRDGDERQWSIVYVAATAIGVGTHLYMCPVVLGHMVVVAVRRPDDGRWGPRWVLGLGLGAAFYVAMIDELLESRGDGGRVFLARFPLELGEVAVGSGVAAACITVAALVGAWVQLRHRRELVLAGGVVAAAVAWSWLVWRPALLNARFHLWVIPAVAALVGAAVARSRGIAALVAVGVVLNAFSVRDGYTGDTTSLPPLAAILRDAASTGDRGCVVERSVLPMLAYTDDFEVIEREGELDACDVVAIPFPSLDPDLVDAARARFRVTVVVESYGEDGLVLSGIRR